MKRFSLIHIFLAALLIFAIALPDNSSGARLSYKGVYEIDHLQEGRIYYLSLSDLVETLGLQIHFDPVTMQAELVSGQDNMDVSLFATYLRFNDNLRNITYPILYRKGDLYIPAQTALPVLGEFAKVTLVWDAKDMTIHAADISHNVLDLQFSSRSNGYLCEIILAHPIEYEVFTSEGNWLQITLQGGELDEKYISSRPHSRVIRRIRAFQFANSAQISINFRRDISEFTHNAALNPPRIQVAIIDTLFDYSSIDTVFSDADFDPVDVIILDAGHGGIEDGAIGPEGTREKEIVLDIAKRVKRIFEEKDDIKIVLTRENDTTLLLDERAAIANGSNGDMFVSIHANWFERQSAKGTQTFFLAAALNDAARATAMLENRSILVNKDEGTIDSLSELDMILFDLLQTEYLTESQALAYEVQTELVKSLQTRDRGVDQAGFFVLNKVFMPSVLIEVAFISNKHEEALLNKESFREKTARGIYKGIKNFIDKYSPDS